MSFDNTILISKKTSLSEVLDYIKKIAVESSVNEQIKEIASKCLKDQNPLKCVFDFVYANVVYEPDPEGRQIIRTPYRTLFSKKGNCVDYATLIGAILLAMNYKFAFKTVSFEGANDMAHIYVVSNGVILDPVLGHKQDGTDTFSNRPSKGKFNQELKYNFDQMFVVSDFEKFKYIGRKVGKKTNGRISFIRSKNN